MNNKKKRQRKASPAPSMVTPSRSATTPKNAKVAVTGNLLHTAVMNAVLANQNLHDEWFSADDWCSVLPQYCSTLKGHEEEVTTKKLCRRMNQSVEDEYNAKSESGFYANRWGNKNEWYYLYTKKDKCPNPPRTDGNFYPSNIKNFVPQMEEDGDTNNNSNDDNNGNTQQQPQCQPQQQKRSEQLAQQNYFHSGKAWNLFMPHGTTKPDNDDAACAVLVKTFIEARIAVCEEGAEDWFTAVRGGNDSDDASHSEIDNIQHKCRYIMVALQHALDKMGDGLTTWRECCEHALNAMKLVGIKYITCAETIERWHMQLRDSGDEKFPHPNPQVAAGQIVEPQFFVGCPTAKMMFLSHADELARKGTLTSEALADYVNAQVVPLHLNEFNEGKDETNKISRPNFLLSFGLGRGRPTMHQDENEPQEGKKNISQETILRWMKLYGYKWCTARKHYYNDTHEHPLTLKARKLYIHTVLFQYETRALRWIQIPKKDADLLRQQSADGKQHVADDAGYEYEAYDADGNLCCYVEFNALYPRAIFGQCFGATQNSACSCPILMLQRAKLILIG